MRWTVEKRSVKDLLPADYNPRTLSQKERLDLQKSIQEFGQVVPIVVNIGKRNNTLIGGHQRVQIYADLGYEEVDVMVPERPLTLAEEKRLNLRLNKNTGSWDDEKLKAMGIELLGQVGFDSPYLDSLYRDRETREDNFDVRKAIKEAKQPITKKGECWQLGEHRLYVGDSTSHADVGYAMDTHAHADVIYCDPPYNIGLDYTKGIGQKANYGGSYSAKKDSKTDIAYKGFVGATMQNALSFARKDAHVFYWCDEKYIGMVQSLFYEQGVENKRVCLWIKNSANPTPGVAFNKVYEPCVYGVRGKPHLNHEIRNVSEVMNKELDGGKILQQQILDMTTLWVVPRDSTTDYEHPTQKPVTLNEKPLKRVATPGQVVLDLFGGSGSTLIACEQLKLKAVLVEQDPVFATVIIRRWERFTGKKAKKI